MGALRMYLALTVLLWHHLSVPVKLMVFLFPNSFIAVCIFFIISGFYISMVLSESYDHPYGTCDFYLNRLLRIYPVYFVAILGLVVVSNSGLIHPEDFPFPSNSPFLFHAWMGEAERCWKIMKQVLIFPYAFSILNPYDFLTLGQMFTVGIELLFYALAPFLVKRSFSALAVLFVFSMGIHFAPFVMKLPARIWQYEFFPCVLMFFLAGALSYRLYKVIRLWQFPPRWGWLSLGAMFCYFLCFRNGMNDGHWTNTPATVGLYMLVVLSIPFLFNASKDSKIDRFIGDISYPFYVVHFIVIWVFGTYPHNAFLVPAITLTISVLLVCLVERPMAKFRHGLSVKKLLRGQGNFRNA